MENISIGGWNAIGVSLQLAGTLLLFKYGMPGRVRTGGNQAILMEQVDHHAVGEEAHYDQMGYFGLTLTIVGGLAQAIVSLAA